MTEKSKHPSSLSGDNHHIVLYDCDEDLPIVVFWGAKDLASEQFNFFQMGRELKAHRFFFNNGENHWYQHGVPSLANTFDKTVEILQQWKKALSASEIVFIGTSMGGYAALQYGEALNARVCAFSVDAILNAPLSQSSQHYTGTTPPTCEDLCNLIKSNGERMFVVVGERNIPDLHSAASFRKETNVNVISVVGVGHYLPSYLSRQSRLGPLVRSFIQTGQLDLTEYVGNALDSGDYVQLIFDAALEAKKPDADWALVKKQLTKALKLYPGGEAAQILLGEALLKLGENSEAVDILSQAIIGTVDDFDTLIWLSAALRKIGALARSKAICYFILGKRPGNLKALSTLSLTYAAEKDYNNACKYMKRALAIYPKHPTYMKHIEKFEREMKKKINSK